MFCTFRIPCQTAVAAATALVRIVARFTATLYMVMAAVAERISTLYFTTNEVMALRTRSRTDVEV